MKNRATAALILSAGRSSRMKSHKALLPIDNSIFLDKLLTTFQDWGCEEIVIVLSEDLARQYSCPRELKGKVTLVINDHLEFERFYSVQLGLRAINKSDFCFVHNVDNPLITGENLDLIFKGRKEDAWVSPRFQNKGGHPVLLSRKIMEQISDFSRHDVLLNEILAGYPCTKVEMPGDTILVNMNEVTDLEQHIKIKKE